MRALAAWVHGIALRPWRTLVVAALLTAGCAWYASQTLKMNSDDSALVSQDEPFRQDFKALVESFPQFEDTTLIVVTSESIDLADDAVDRMLAALETRDDLVRTLYAPSADPFFEDNGLLYLDLDELDDVIERLAEAQPALTALAEDPSLRGLFEELELSLDELVEEGELPPGFTRMAGKLNETIDSMLAGKPRSIGWADEFMAVDDTVYRVIVVQGQTYFDEPISSGRLIGGIREIVQNEGLVAENGVTVRLTGMVPLGHEELEAMQDGLAGASVLAFTLLAVILGFGVRSLRIIIGTFVTLIVSFTWTTAWAMASVGEFNIISAAFGVLLIGLGVDFAIHLGLHYEEQTRLGKAVPIALRDAAAGVGGAIALCAITSAIGFLSFAPTRYSGVAALGVIAGGGMIVTFIASFVVFPAVLALMRAPSRQRASRQSFFSRLLPVIERHSGLIVGLTAVTFVAAVGITTQARFDFSTLGMKDPESESMTTLKELGEQDIITDYAATVLAPNAERAEALAAELEALELVSDVHSPASYVPDEQADKLLALEDAAFFLESVLYPTEIAPALSVEERRRVLDALHEKISALPEGRSGDPAWQVAYRLGENMGRLLEQPDVDGTARQLEHLVVADLAERLDWLRRAITVEAVTFEDLPAEMRERLISSDGRARVDALPAEDLSDVDALTRFANAVASVSPSATGRPAVEVGIGEIVVSTFRMAIGIAFVAVGCILLWALRSVSDALLVLLPITLAAFITIAVGVMIGVPFNMANVVAIPLILGLGIDNGIHVFMRFRRDGSIDQMMGSSTPRAVMLSAFTTLAAFGSLSVSRHWGIHSLGLLLSISVVSLIVCTLIVLPALILFRQQWRSRRTGGSA